MGRGSPRRTALDWSASLYAGGLTREELPSGREWAVTVRRYRRQVRRELGACNGLANIACSMLDYLASHATGVDLRAVGAIAKDAHRSPKRVQWCLAELDRRGVLARVEGLGIRLPGQRGHVTNAYTFPGLWPGVPLLPQEGLRATVLKLRGMRVALAARGVEVGPVDEAGTLELERRGTPLAPYIVAVERFAVEGEGPPPEDPQPPVETAEKGPPLVAENTLVPGPMGYRNQITIGSGSSIVSEIPPTPRAAGDCEQPAPPAREEEGGAVAPSPRDHSDGERPPARTVGPLASAPPTAPPTATAAPPLTVAPSAGDTPAAHLATHGDCVGSDEEGGGWTRSQRRRWDRAVAERHARELAGELPGRRDRGPRVRTVLRELVAVERAIGGSQAAAVREGVGAVGWQAVRRALALHAASDAWLDVLAHTECVRELATPDGLVLELDARADLRPGARATVRRVLERERDEIERIASGAVHVRVRVRFAGGVAWGDD